MHRYNEFLPPLCHGRIVKERELHIRALRSLAKALVTPDPEARESDTCPSDRPVAEAYDRPIERDFAAFEKGLSRCIELKYGFEPNDYDMFVSTLLRGATTISLDMGLRSKLARVCVRLLRKKDCVLEHGIPWRRVLHVVLKTHLECVDGGPYIGRDVRDAHCRNFTALLKKCRYHLRPEDNADDIWLEFSSGFDLATQDGSFRPLLILAHVLPTRGTASLNWVPDGLSIFERLANSPDWDTPWLALFARVAKHQPAAVDWAPHLPFLYSRIVSIFKLPLGSAAPQSPVERRCPHHLMFLLSDKTTSAAAKFVVYTLGPSSGPAMDLLRRLVQLLSSYFHPSNGGRWSPTLGAFLQHTCTYLAARVSSERSATSAGHMDRIIGSRTTTPVAPESGRLRDSDIDEVVSLLLPLVQQGIHSKIPSMTVQAASAARDLAAISPEKVVEPLLSIAAECLESISSPHRTSAALKLLASLSPVFLDPELYPNGADALPQALTLVLPGIDPNDPQKTESTLRFIAGACARIQALVAGPSPQSPSLSYFLEDYAHQLLERIFALLDSLEAPAKKGRNGSAPSPSSQQLSSFIFGVAMENLFAALPGPVAISTAERICAHITSTTSLNAKKHYGALIRSSMSAATDARADADAAPLFIPQLIGQLLLTNGDGKTSNPSLANLSEDEIVWKLRMLAQACREAGSGLAPYAKDISKLVSLSMSRSERVVYKAGGRLLRGLLEGLTATKFTTKASSYFSDDWNNRLSQSQATRIWRIPSESDWNLGEELLRAHQAEAERLAYTGALDSEPESTKSIFMDREVLFRVLRMLHAIQRGGRWIMAGVVHSKFSHLFQYADTVEGKSRELSKSDALLALKMPISAGLGGNRNEEASRTATSMWSRIHTLTLEILRSTLKARPDDGALLYRCLEPLELSHEPFRRGNQGRLTAYACRGYKAAFKPVMARKYPQDAVGSCGRAMPGFIFKLRVEAQHELRLSLAGRAGAQADDLFESIMSELTKISLNAFPRVRNEARGVLTRAFRVAKPASRRREVCRIIDAMANAGTAAAQIKAPSHDNSESAATSQAAPVPASLQRLKLDPTSNLQAKDVVFETIIGASQVLRSTSAAPLIMRDWDLFSKMSRVLVNVVVAAERPDAAASVATLFGKLASLARPLRVRPFRLVNSELEEAEPVTNANGEFEERTRLRMARVDELNDYMLSLVRDPSESSTAAPAVANDAEKPGTIRDPASSSAHWRMQTFVLTILSMCIQEDFAPPAQVAEHFAASMTSEVVTVRQVAAKAVSLIGALHRTKLVYKSARSEASIRAIEAVVCGDGFAKKLVSVFALDHDDGAAGDGGGGSRAQHSSFSIGGLSRYCDGDACWMVFGGAPWPATWTPRSQDALILPQVRFYESLARVYGKSTYTAFSSYIEYLLVELGRRTEQIIEGVVDEKLVRVIASEVIGGFARGLKVDALGSPEIAEQACEKLYGWVSALLAGFTGPEGAINGGTLIRLVVSASEGTVGAAIASRLVEGVVSERPLVVAMDDGAAAHVQARRLRYAHSCVADQSPDTQGLALRVIEAASADLTNVTAFGHELKAVREEVARLLSVLSMFTTGDARAEYLKGVEVVANRQRMPANFRAPVDAGADASHDEPDADEEGKKARSRQGETLSRWISIVCWNGNAIEFGPYLATLLPAVLSTLGEESDAHRVSHARLALSLAAQVRMSATTFHDILLVCDEMSRSPRYRIRGALLPFLQTIGFSLLFVAKDESLAILREIVMRLLRDDQVEVREAAAATFVPIIRDAPADAIAAVRDEFVNTVDNSMVRLKNRKRVSLTHDQLRDKHGAVLGLGSMVASCPYTVPEWMPRVLVSLSYCLGDPPPISMTSRKIFTDFMRTHRDEWTTHKQAFSPEELETVSEVLVSPSYYA